MLQVTLQGGKKVYLNPNKVHSIESRPGGGAAIFNESEDAPLLVTESPEFVLDLLSVPHLKENFRLDQTYEAYLDDMRHVKKYREVNMRQMEFLIGAAIVSAVAQVIIGALLLLK